MSTPTAGLPCASAVIVVCDEALAWALELTLLACDAEATLCDPATPLSALPLSGEAILIIDRQLLPREARAAIKALRSHGWRGLAVLMIEDASILQADFDAADHVVILEKPFGGAELVALVQRARASRQASPRRSPD